MEEMYPIRVVAAKTGLSTHLIRMWERRYGAVEPGRTDSKRRLYSDADVKRLTLLRRATQAGANIGQIANLADDDLDELVASYERLSPGRPLRTSDAVDAGYFLNLAIDSIEALDSRATESALRQASISLGRTVLFEKVLRPLLTRIGSDWSAGMLKVAHEHLASAVLRTFLGHMAENTPVNTNSPVIVITTPAGQRHEFGALMATVTATEVGWQTVYLGANLPSEDIAATARQTNASAVGLSIIYPPDDPHIVDELHSLRQMIGAECKIIAGGRSAKGYARALKNIDAIVLDSLYELSSVLEQIRNNAAATN